MTEFELRISLQRIALCLRMSCEACGGSHHSHCKGTYFDMRSQQPNDPLQEGFSINNERFVISGLLGASAGVPWENYDQP